MNDAFILYTVLTEKNTLVLFIDISTFRELQGKVLAEGMNYNSSEGETSKRSEMGGKSRRMRKFKFAVK